MRALAGRRAVAFMPRARAPRPDTGASSTVLSLPRAPDVLQKLLALVMLVLLVGHVFFRPQLRQLGARLDKFVSMMVIAIVISYVGQLIILWATSH